MTCAASSAPPAASSLRRTVPPAACQLGRIASPTSRVARAFTPARLQLDLIVDARDYAFVVREIVETVGLSAARVVQVGR